MPHITNNDKYTTVMIFTSIQNELRRVSGQLKKTQKNKSWSVSRLFNLACMEFLGKIGHLNDTALQELFDRYEVLKAEEDKEK